MKWDLYDKDFKFVGKTIEESRNDEIPDGLYHMTVNVWIINSQKQVLLLKKVLNFNLRYPGLWTSINGNVKSGETSIECVKNVVKQKIGITVDEKSIVELGKDVRDPHHYIFNTFVVYMDIDLEEIEINEKIISKVKWVDIKELENMISNGEMELPLLPRIDNYIKNIINE